MKDLLTGQGRRLSQLPAPVRVLGIVLGAVLVSLGSFGGVRFFDYMQNDPRFCRSCHTMQRAWDRWSQSAHRTVSCHNCHEQGPITSMELLVKYVVQQPDKVSKHATVPDETCEKCHESDNPRWLQIAATAGHKKHAEEEELACTKCHSLILHRFEPPKQICGVCHTEQQIKIPEMADLHCLNCHDFLATQTDLLPERERCLACHKEMPQIKVTWPADAPMKWKCGACHKPHEQFQPTVDCASCHQDASLTGLHTKQSHSIATCQACHRPHEWRITKPDPCLACHTNKVEHKSGTMCTRCHEFKQQK